MCRWCIYDCMSTRQTRERQAVTINLSVTPQIFARHTPFICHKFAPQNPCLQLTPVMREVTVEPTTRRRNRSDGGCIHDGYHQSSIYGEQRLDLRSRYLLCCTWHVAYENGVHVRGEDISSTKEIFAGH